ncbi:MAG TPA: hypothetical protein VH560_19105 [Polyangia bacterium]|nr:hypothetical protein [Polyangia bacterium]
MSATLSADARRCGYATSCLRAADIANDDRWHASAVALAACYLEKAESREKLEAIKGALLNIPFVVITDVCSLILASRVVRLGAHAVLARPTTFSQLLAAVRGAVEDDMQPMSLDRAIWEHLNQALVEAGTISRAARRLRLDRSSFKRMLRKFPPGA